MRALQIKVSGAQKPDEKIIVHPARQTFAFLYRKKARITDYEKIK